MSDTKTNIEPPLLLSAKQAASICGISRSMFYSMLSSGEIGVMPIRLRNRVLFNRKELECWIDAGCEPREVYRRVGK